MSLSTILLNDVSERSSIYVSTLEYNRILGPSFHKLIPNDDSKTTAVKNAEVLQYALTYGSGIYALPNGTYTVLGPLTVKRSGLGFTSNSRDTTGLRQYGDTPLFHIEDTDNKTTVDDFTISNITIDGILSDAPYCVLSEKTKNLEFSNCIFTNMPHSTISLLNCVDAIIKENIFENTKDGTMLVLDPNCTGCVIHDNEFNYCSTELGIAAAVALNGTANIFSSNTIYRTIGYNLIVTGNGCTITDNILEFATKSNMTFANVKNTIMSNNVCKYANQTNLNNTDSVCVDFFQTCSRNIITSNIFYSDTTTTAAVVKNTVTFPGKTANGIPLYFMYLTVGAANNTIQANEISGMVNNTTYPLLSNPAPVNNLYSFNTAGTLTSYFGFGQNTAVTPFQKVDSLNSLTAIYNEIIDCNQWSFLASQESIGSAHTVASNATVNLLIACNKLTDVTKQVFIPTMVKTTGDGQWIITNIATSNYVNPQNTNITITLKNVSSSTANNYKISVWCQILQTM